ncbi:MAG: Fic family protein [Deltaproteobacteria bacterium]|nr:Fic family protein [Deltaproteobacteria bacterium]
MSYIWQDKKWPRLTWQADQLTTPLGQCRFAQGQLLARIRMLGLGLDKESQAEILVHEAVQTSAIEGTVIDPQAVRSSVVRRLGLPSAGLPPSNRYIDGVVNILLEATTHYAAQLSATRLKGWQAALFPTGFSGMQRVRVGQWRSSDLQVLSGPIGRERIHYEAPPAARIAKEMAQFFLWWHRSQRTIDGLIRAAVAHVYFVTIHPFDDGNGRIARTLTDMALAQDEQSAPRYYSLSAQIMAERDAYYRALESAQQGGLDITEWLRWFLECMTRAITRSETMIANILARSEFWRAFAAVSLSDRQRKVVHRLLEAGPDGFVGGLTTRKYVGLTKCSRATAFREMADLIAKGLLCPSVGRGRNASYQLRWLGKAVADG